ncbi:unnamed protein product [Arctogadus glacialis]
MRPLFVECAVDEFLRDLYVEYDSGVSNQGVPPASFNQNNAGEVNRFCGSARFRSFLRENGCAHGAGKLMPIGSDRVSVSVLIADDPTTVASVPPSAAGSTQGSRHQ